MNAEQKVSVPKRSLKEDDEEETKPVPPPKAGLLPTGLSRAIVISAVCLTAILLTPMLVAHRYVLVPAPRSDNALMFRIDSLTGKVSLCSATQCTALAERDSGAAP